VERFEWAHNPKVRGFGRIEATDPLPVLTVCAQRRFVLNVDDRSVALLKEEPLRHLSA
jgi:hypothetical protein